MTKSICITLLMLVQSLCAGAQRMEVAAPKWAAKAQKAIVSVVTYDQNKELLHSGNGVFIGEDGMCIAEYELFRNAYSAVVITMDGKKLDVEKIMGADNNYNLVKFKASGAKVAALTPAPSTAGTAGTTTYALEYSKVKVAVCPSVTVEKKDIIDGKYAYYTLAKAFDTKLTGAPLFDEHGELLGIVQSPLSGKSYAVDAALGRDLSIRAIQTKSAQLALQQIHIRTGLPETTEEALVYLYFQSRTADDDTYLALLNDFISTWPGNAEGYYRRATPLLDTHQFDAADHDLQTYLRLAADKKSAYSNAAQTIYTKLLYQPEPPYEKWSYDLALSYVDKAIALAETEAGAQPADSLRQESELSVIEYKLQKAQILMTKQEDRAALAIYNEVNSSPYRSAATYYVASMAHEAAGDSLDVQIALMDSAINMFSKPLPQEAANYVMRRGQLYARAGRYRDAVAAYNEYEYLQNHEVSAAFLYDRAVLEEEARMYEQALDDLRKATDMEPGQALYYVELSGLHLRVNQIDECIRTAEQAISLDSRLPDAYRILGYAQILKNDKEPARQNLDRAIALGDENAKVVKEKYLK